MSRRSNKSLTKRIVIDIAGFGLIIISPLLGWLPGPGGIPIFIAGLAILARNYDWADNLLKDFDRRRIEFTNKYLVNNRKVSMTIDGLSILIILMATAVITFADNQIFKLMSVGVMVFSVFIIISNQKRIDRLIKKLKH